MQWSENKIGKLIHKIYTGQYNALNLPKKLYKDIANHLTGGVYKGFGSTISGVEYDSPDFVMLNELRLNTYLFSAAKTFNYVLSTENLITEGNKILPFDEFKTRARQVYKDFNETWLEAEYNTAIGQAQSSRAWMDFSEDAILRYMVTPGVVHADVCLAMQDVTRPKNDPIWRKNSPLQHFGCLCHLDASFDNVAKPLPKNIPNPPAGFDFNPGIEKKVFGKDHPYFTEIPTKYKTFAKQNFDLPLPKDKK